MFYSVGVDENNSSCTADVGLDDVVAADHHEAGDAAHVPVLVRGQQTEARQQTQL